MQQIQLPSSPAGGLPFSANESDLEAKSDFNFIIAYDDLAIGKRAKETCDYFSSRLGGGHNVHCSIWRMDMLKDPSLKRSAVNDALGAQMIIIATRGEDDLSTDAKIWIELWLQEKCKKSSFLLSLFDQRKARKWVMDVISRYLRKVALRGKMEFFTHPVNPTAAEAMLPPSISQLKKG